MKPFLCCNSVFFLFYFFFNVFYNFFVEYFTNIFQIGYLFSLDILPICSRYFTSIFSDTLLIFVGYLQVLGGNFTNVMYVLLRFFFHIFYTFLSAISTIFFGHFTNGKCFSCPFMFICFFVKVTCTYLWQKKMIKTPKKQIIML